jgi:hypothetical protein
MISRRLSGALLAVLVAGSALTASAQGRDPSTMKSYSAPGTTAPRSSLPVLPPVVIVPRDRTVIQSYYKGHGGPGQGRAAAAGHCPPGQAKKGNCVPGPEARRAVAPNSRLPTGMSVSPLPRPLLERLTLAPPGYSYGYLDGSVVLYATGSRLVADVAPAF